MRRPRPPRMVRTELGETALVVATGLIAFLTLALVVAGYLLLAGRIGS
jgi:hypothetical protein